LIDSGKLRCYATFERKAKTPDEGGGRVGAWVTVAANVPCDIRDASPREVYYAGQRQVEVSHVLETRYLTGFNSNWRVVWQGREFLVTGYRDSKERRRQMFVELLERKQSDSD
jgi:SPP1 family predicted phage head-tail adaptor